jgi:serine/threonine-protein kinase
MAEVFLAKALGAMGFEKLMVLKRILPHLAEDQAFVEMFLSEARLAAQLNHPNIVQVFDFGEAAGAHFLAMEYIDGPNLRVLIQRARARGLALPAPLCARIISSACEGLAFAHDSRALATGEPLGVIHRDISPDNILLSRQGAVKVADFGIAKATGQLHKTRSGVLKGKLAYMPPEQLRAMPVDRRVDVYALGVVLYELLTLHKPFNATVDANIMRAVLFEPRVPAVERRADLPDALQRILERAMAKHRDDRYPDCRAFQEDLEAFLLSTGKPLGPHHLAQFVEQVMSELQAPPPRPAPPQCAQPDGAQTVPRVEEDTAQQPMAPPTQSHGTRARLLVGASIALLVMGGGYAFARARKDLGQSGPEAIPAELAGAERPVPAMPRPSLEPPQPRLPPPQTEAGLTATPKTVLASSSGMPRPESAQRVQRPKPSASAERGAASTGLLELRIRPYASVFIDGQALGQTPLKPVELAAGEHTVTLVNLALNKQATKRIVVTPGQRSILKVNLANTDAPVR